MDRIFAVGIFLALGGAAFYVLVRASAHEGSGRMAGVQAQIEEQQGTSPIGTLRRAVELSPREAIYHSRLGLALEAQGELNEAERELVEGARLSRKYEPRWNLANFYFRRGKWDRFWPVVAEALPMSWGPRSPLFTLALEADGGRGRLEPLLPARRDIRLDYASFLLTKGDVEAAAPFVAELASGATADEKDLFLSWIDLLLDRHLVGRALQTWNALRVPGDAFPWKAGSAQGLSARAIQGEWRVGLNGSQPEHCVLLESVKPVRAGERYRLQPNLEDRLTPAGGLVWHIESLEASPRTLEQVFTAPVGIEAVRVRLEYQRPQGSVRGEGDVHARPVLQAEAK